MGLTFYKEHKIWIAKELCDDEKARTLKHELTHCYIWENGFYNIDFNNCQATNPKYSICGGSLV